MGVKHLTTRFFGSVAAEPLTNDEQAWVKSQLLPAEFALWTRFQVADQRHTYAVGRKTVELLGDKATRPVVAAALLHDIGKIEANVGTLGRVLATMAKQTATPAQIESWSKEEGWLGDAGRYIKHNEIGAKMLEEAGSDPLTSTWAYEHEIVHTKWTLPTEITDALWKADN